jgi:hypothetical protein
MYGVCIAIDLDPYPNTWSCKLMHKLTIYTTKGTYFQRNSRSWRLDGHGKVKGIEHIQQQNLLFWKLDFQNKVIFESKFGWENSYSIHRNVQQFPSPCVGRFRRFYRVI